ncbi:MAG TPA: TlpA disulfide reductase family protein [Anaerolineales bacterium]|nr:TlpA disulfide reductase family protein [Anaerolineales bacterium]
MSDFHPASTVPESPAPPASRGGRILVFGLSLSLGAVIAWAALFLLLVILALGLIRSQQGPVAQGQSAPDFTLTTFDGQPYTLSEFKGKVVVINFWASWCKPCEQEAADLETAWQSYQGRGDVIFLGVDYVDTEPEALAYLKRFNITYPNGPDQRTRISQAYRIRGVPETYVVGPDGILTFVKIGPFNSLAEIQAVIDPVLPR